MHLSIDHVTRYRYDRPAAGVMQVLRLTPRGHEGQQVLRWRVDVDADGRLIPFEDSHGNLCHAFYADGALEELTIRVTGEVSVSDTAGVVQGVYDPMPPAVYRRVTPLTAVSPGIAALAARAADPDPVRQAHALMLAVSEAVTFETGATGPATAAAAAFALGRGVCQDMAQILIAAARHLGVPARYVSGHYAAPGHPEQEAAHAWAELHVPALGWISLDPAHGISASEGHVRVAVGLDALDAAPVRGSRRGGGAESLAVEVHGRESPARGSQGQWVAAGVQVQQQG
jgi:transglutaminase-like putative cysteine protease